MSDTRFRVVLAEDEALIRMDLKEMLEESDDAGYQIVGEAADGAAAIELATQLRPDVVIMDVKMPVLDGISAAERIAELRLAPVVILTAFSQQDLVRRASSAGAMAYLVKPFTRADLIPAIEIAMSRFAEIKALDSEVSGLRDRLETRKVLERAKGLLQARNGITEAEAFRWIQKTSMDRRVAMRVVAREILGEAQPPDDGAGPPDDGAGPPGGDGPRGGDTGPSASGDAGPRGGDAGPSAGDDAGPPGEDERPSAAQARTRAAQAKPSAARAKPSAARARPPGGLAKPSAIQAAPQAAQAQPQGPQAPPPARVPRPPRDARPPSG